MKRSEMRELGDSFAGLCNPRILEFRMNYVFPISLEGTWGLVRRTFRVNEVAEFEATDFLWRLNNNL